MLYCVITFSVEANKVISDYQRTVYRWCKTVQTAYSFKTLHPPISRIKTQFAIMFISVGVHRGRVVRIGAMNVKTRPLNIGLSVDVYLIGSQSQSKICRSLLLVQLLCGYQALISCIYSLFQTFANPANTLFLI